MFSISYIRAQARQTINSTPGIYYLPIIPVALTLVISLFQYISPKNIGYSVYDTIPSGSSIFGLAFFPMLYSLLLGFISISLTWTLLQVIRGAKKTTDIKDALAVFNSPHLGKIFCTYLLKQFFLFLWGLVFYIGVGLFIVTIVLFAFYVLMSGGIDFIPEEELAVISLFILLGLALALGGFILIIPQYLAYSQVEFILFDQLENNTYAGAASIIKSSRQLMKGYKGKRLVLDLSFIGWFILVSITFGLVGIYVWPYYHAAQAHFYEALKKDHHIIQAAYFGPTNQTTPNQAEARDSFYQTPQETPESSTASPIDKPVEKAVENKMDSAIDSPIDHQE